MKTRKTKKRNIIRRAVAFLLCMTMVLGLGMQDVIEQVYAEEASAVSPEQSADVPATQEVESTETTTPEGETDPTASEETGPATPEEEPTAPEEDKKPAEPTNPTETEGNTEVAAPPTETTDPTAPPTDPADLDDPSAPTTPADGTENAKPAEPTVPETPADSNGSGSSGETTSGEDTEGEGTPSEGGAELPVEEKPVSELTYAAEDGSFSVKATAASEDVDLSGIEIHAAQVQKDGEEYAAAEELVAGALDAESRQIEELQAYDIWFTYTENGETADLSGQVQISLEYTAPEFPEGTDAQLEVFCLNGGAAEAVDGTDALAAGCELYALAWAVPAESTDTWEWTDGQVIIKASADKGVLPEGAEISVTPIVKTEEEELVNLSEEERAEAEAINEQYAQTEEKLTEDLEVQAAEEAAALPAAEADAVAIDAASDSEETADAATAKTLEGFLAYDICFLVNGEEVEPADGEVNVFIEFNEAVIPEGVSEDAEVSVAHLKEEKNENGVDEIVVEDLTTAETTTVETTEKAEVKKVELVAESFSTFTIYWSNNTSYRNLKIVVVDEAGNPVTASNRDYYYGNGSTRSVQEIADQIQVPNGYEFVEAKVGTEFDSASEIKRLRYNYGNQYSTDESGDHYWQWEDIGEDQTVWFVFKNNAAIRIDDKITEEGLLRAVVSEDLQTQIDAAEEVQYVWSKSENGSEFIEVELKKSGSNFNLQDTNRALDIVIDDADKANGTKYKVAVYLNGSEDAVAESAEFEVPYYTQIQNGDFEKPVSDGQQNYHDHGPSNKNLAQWSNENYAYQGGVWQTTGVGTNDGDNNTEGQDIEVLNVDHTSNQNEQFTSGSADKGAADAEDGGKQYAEINCETSGALYQDVLTEKGADLNYWLSHKARSRNSDPGLASQKFDTMYLVIMPTADAENLNTHKKLVDYLNGKLSNKGLVPEIPVESAGVKISTIEQKVIYNEGGLLIARITSNADNWQSVRSDTIEMGEGVTETTYRPISSLSRFFFISGGTYASKINTDDFNGNTIGNLVDSIGFGQVALPPTKDEIKIEIEKTVTGLTEEQFNKLKDTLTFTIHGVEYDSDSGVSGDAAPLNGNEVKANACNWEENVDPMTHLVTATMQTSLTAQVTGWDKEYFYRVEESGATVSGTVLNSSVEVRVTGGTRHEDGAILGEREAAVFDFTNEYVSSEVDVTFTKTDENAEPLSGVEFALYEHEEDIKPIKTAESDSNGTVTFEGLEPGAYYLKETSTPSGFVAAGPWTIEVGTPAGGYTITGPGVSGDSTEGYSIENRSFESAIQVDKTVEVLNYDDRTYNITLSAKSLLNEITQSGEPVDVVLVLDVSRSMWFPGNLKEVNKYAHVTNRSNSDLKEGQIYYYISPVSAATVYQIEEINGAWRYIDSSGNINDPNEWKNVDEGDSIFSNKNTYTIYQATDNTRRLDSLRDAATSFINNLNELSSENRVGVVPFAENVMNGDVVTIDTLAENYAALVGTDGYITELGYSDTASGTDQREGLEVAKNMLTDNSSNHKKYVILLTDGAPNWKTNNGEGTKVGIDECWNQIDEAADSLKETATLMTVGIGISYVDAGIEESKEEAPFASDKLKEISMNNGTPYYYNVDQSDELEGVFDSLFSTIVSGIPVEGVKITDVIDSRFELVDSENIPQRGEYDPSTGTIIWDANLPYVSGDEAGWTVTFTIKAKDEFMGGNVIPTNGSASGVSKDDSIVPFPQPAVNVKSLELQVPSREETIYLGDDVNVAENVAKIKEVLAEKVENDVQGDESPTFEIPTNCQLTDDEILTLLNGGSVRKSYSYEGTTDVVGEFVYSLVIGSTMRTDGTDFNQDFESNQVGDARESYTLTVQYVPKAVTDRNQEGYVYDSSEPEKYGEVSAITEGTGTYRLNVIAGSIDIIKQMREPAAEDKVFTFKVEYEDQSVASIEVTITVEAGETEGKLSAEEQAKLMNLKRGGWTISEVAVDGYSVSQIVVGQGSNSKFEISDPPTSITFTLGTSDDGSTDTLKSENYTKGRLGVAVFTNDRVFTNWQIKKVSSSNSETVLEGAKFKLESETAGGETYYGLSGVDGIIQWYDDEACSGNVIDNKDLKPDIYELSEIYAPSGYSLSQEKWTVEITANGVKSIIGEDGNQIVPTDNGNKVMIYNFENELLYELPEAGGPGIHLYMLGGTLLMMAGALLVYKKRKEEVLRS